MKKLLALSCLMFAVGCGDMYVYIGLDVDPAILADYNVILHIKSDGDPVCGATLVNSNTAITAAHCIAASYRDYFIEPSDGVIYPVEIIAVNAFETSDLAVLRIEELLYQPVATVSTGEPRFGEDIWVIGCGGGECDALSKGIVSKLGVIDHYDMVANQFDVTAWYGNSGGGIFDATGELVGVVSQFGPQGGGKVGWMYGCTVGAINKILKEASLEQTD